MIIAIWIVSIISVMIIGGEARYRYLKKEKEKKLNKINNIETVSSNKRI